MLPKTEGVVATKQLAQEIDFGPTIHLSWEVETQSEPLGSSRRLRLQGVSGGEVVFPLPEGVEVSLLREVGRLRVEVTGSSPKARRRSLGTTLALLRQKGNGLRQGFKRCLKLVGVGYRASLPDEGGLLLRLGYSHPVLLPLSPTLEVVCPNPTTIFIRGGNLQEVSQQAADIRRWRLPEPYKGKGIFYQGETITRKEGKKN
jgi:large subunit ribosomal protein L6